MTEEQRNVALGLVIFPNGRRKISPEQFLALFPSALENGKLALSVLEGAAVSKSSDDVRAAIIVGATFGFSDRHVRLLCQLLLGDRHTCDEDIVHALQGLKDPRAIEPLFTTVFVSYPYLAYDDSFGLARKCTWALADISTTEARSKLEQIASSPNPMIAGYAKKRLDYWEDERSRKGA